jgi:hypothetical protein
MLMIVVICVTVKRFSKTICIFMLLILVFIQYQDMSLYFERKGTLFREERVWETSLKSDMWDVIASDFDHLFYLEDSDNLFPILRFVAQNQLTINDTYLARKETLSINTLKLETMNNLHDGIAEDNMVYFFQTMPMPLIINNILYVYEFDGIIAGFAYEIEDAKFMDGVTHHSGNEFIFNLRRFNTQNGVFTNRGFISDGSSDVLLYGPNIQLPQGSYEVEIILSLDSFTQEEVGLIEIVAQWGASDILSLPIAASDFLYATQTFSLPFILYEEAGQIEFRVLTSEGTIMVAENVILHLVDAS